MLSFSQSMLLGARASVGYFISTVLFGLMFGAAAAGSGLDMWQGVLMSGVVFSATAQFAALELWLAPLSILTILLSTLLVSSRNILLGMAMTHHFDAHSHLRRALCLGLLTDPGALTVLQLKGREDKLGFATGYGVALWIAWVGSTISGYLFAQYLLYANLAALGFAGPLVLTTVMMLFVKGTNGSVIPLVVSAAIALILHELAVVKWLILPLSVAAGVVAVLIKPVVQNNKSDSAESVDGK